MAALNPSQPPVAVLVCRHGCGAMIMNDGTRLLNNNGHCIGYKAARYNNKHWYEHVEVSKIWALNMVTKHNEKKSTFQTLASIAKQCKSNHGRAADNKNQEEYDEDDDVSTQYHSYRNDIINDRRIDPCPGDPYPGGRFIASAPGNSSSYNPLYDHMPPPPISKKRNPKKRNDAVNVHQFSHMPPPPIRNRKHNKYIHQSSPPIWNRKPNNNIHLDVRNQDGRRNEEKHDAPRKNKKRKVKKNGDRKYYKIMQPNRNRSLNGNGNIIDDDNNIHQVEGYTEENNMQLSSNACDKIKNAEPNEETNSYHSSSDASLCGICGIYYGGFEGGLCSLCFKVYRSYKWNW